MKHVYGFGHRPRWQILWTFLPFRSGFRVSAYRDHNVMCVVIPFMFFAAIRYPDI